MVHVPSKDDLLNLIKDHTDLQLIVGSAIKHPNDQFVKKLGRDFAMKSSKLQSFRLYTIQKANDMYYYTFYNTDTENVTNQIVLETKKDRNTVYLIKSNLLY